MTAQISDNLPYALFISNKFVAPSIWPTFMAETCSGVVLHVNNEGWNFNSGKYLFTTDTK